VASTAGSVMANVATNMSSMSGGGGSGQQSGSAFVRSFDQQNWNVNKDNLIYAMANQLCKFDQLDERFVTFCISKLINKPFDFRKM
jgi:hypothetical protein